jgi:hypothetical protein
VLRGADEVKVSAVEWSALSGVLAGELRLPDSRDYELVRKPAMARFYDVRPAVGKPVIPMRASSRAQL